MLKPPRYQVYLLRCWEERSSHAQTPIIWRYSLEDSHTGERHGFADIDALLTHLRSTLSLLSNERGITQHPSE